MDNEPDQYDRDIAYLTEHPDEIVDAWFGGPERPGNSLFQMCAPKEYGEGMQRRGCPTMIRSEPERYVAVTAEIHDAIAARDSARKLWLIVKKRPIIKCPFCKGAGGEMSGYEELEWSECSTCFQYWEELDDYGVRWANGRLPIKIYLRAKFSIWCGMWYAVRFRDLLRCKIGWHQWIDQPEHGVKLCRVCYDHRETK